MDIREVAIGGVTVGGPGPLALIGGPCVIESESLVFEVAQTLRDVTRSLGVPFIFKSSFDKANRSSVDAFRGPGLADGLDILARVRDRVGVPVLSDIHSIEQAGPAGQILDALQIPAFLCRQTDLLLAAARTGKPVNVKKGQFLAPWDMTNIVRKLEFENCRDILLTERGSTFGYNNLVVDMRSIPAMRSLGYPVVFDGTHSVQLPGGLGRATGGDRAMVPILTRAGVAAGADAVFLEIHPNPDEGLCDGPNMIALEDVRELLEQCLRIQEAVR